jgi:hypothetical protein
MGHPVPDALHRLRRPRHPAAAAEPEALTGDRMSAAVWIGFLIWVAVLAGLAALIVWDCTRPLSA